MAFGVFWLVWILWETLRLGLGGLSLTLFTEIDPTAQRGGWFGQRAVWFSHHGGTGHLCGHAHWYLGWGVPGRSTAKRARLAPATRFVNDILLSAPSIVIGLFVYTVVVARFKSFSGYAGILALALIVIPVVIRTTENMLLLVPASLREAAYALGAPKWKVITMVTLRAARAGVIVGILLAVARIAGETAPLLFTALNNQFWNGDLSKPMASLPVTIFKFAMSPYENWQQLAWAAVFLITLAVLGLNILARVLTRQK